MRRVSRVCGCCARVVSVGDDDTRRWAIGDLSRDLDRAISQCYSNDRWDVGRLDDCADGTTRSVVGCLSFVLVRSQAAACKCRGGTGRWQKKTGQDSTGRGRKRSRDGTRGDERDPPESKRGRAGQVPEPEEAWSVRGALDWIEWVYRRRGCASILGCGLA